MTGSGVSTDILFCPHKSTDPGSFSVTKKTKCSPLPPPSSCLNQLRLQNHTVPEGSHTPENHEITKHRSSWEEKAGKYQHFVLTAPTQLTGLPTPFVWKSPFCWMRRSDAFAARCPGTDACHSLGVNGSYVCKSQHIGKRIQPQGAINHLHRF